MIRNDVSWADYLAMDFMNPSTLVYGCTSMLHLKNAIDRKVEDTKDMRFGRGVHCLLLSPDEFESMFAVMPDFHLDADNVTTKGKIVEQSTSKSTKYYKTRKAEFESANAGKDCLSKSEYYEALMMIEQLHAKPSFRRLFEAAGENREVTLEAEICGVLMKGRVDMLTPQAIPDAKTCRSIKARKFGNDCADNGYNFKMALYQEFVRQHTCHRQCIYVAIEKKQPYDVCVRPIPDDVLAVKLRQAKKILERYKICLESGVWPGVDQGNDDELLYVPEYEYDEEPDWSPVDETEEVEQYF